MILISPICSICNWSNTNLLNIGEVDQPVWICQGCVKREHEKLRSYSLQWGEPNTRVAGMVRDVGPWRSPTQEERESEPQTEA